MHRKELDYVILSKSDIMITYSKDGETSNNFHLSDVSYSERYGKDYIVGYCTEYEKELTFKVEKITYIELEWFDLFGKSMYFKRGLHLLAIRGDNHVAFELRQYKEEDWSIKLCEALCYDEVLATHYMSYYEEDTIGKWTLIDNSERVLQDAIYTFAYKVSDNEEMKEDDEVYRISLWNSVKHNGISYACAFIRSKTTIGELKIPKNVELIAYNRCRYYNDDDFCKHLELAKKLRLI